MVIGILGIQGSREEHAETLSRMGVKSLFVRTPEELKKVDAMILPGGESTTIGMLMRRNGLYEALKKRIEEGLPVYGTCAGAILLAKEIVGEHKADSMQVMDISIRRNAYGAQLDSFIDELSIPSISKEPIEAVFIRAPRIEKTGKSVQILAEYSGFPVLAREGNMLVSTFHPEMTYDTTIHKYFLSLINGAK